jgi:hypothetical protein
MPKTSAKELQRRKEAARLQDRQMLRQLLLQDKQLLEQIHEMRKQGDADGAWRAVTLAQLSPPMAFILNRVWSLRHKEFERAVHRAIVHLLLSDIPLDHDSRAREFIASVFYALAFSSSATKARARREYEARYVAHMKKDFMERGEKSALEAEEWIADSLGLKSVDALRKRIQRARRK